MQEKLINWHKQEADDNGFLFNQTVPRIYKEPNAYFTTWIGKKNNLLPIVLSMYTWHAQRLEDANHKCYCTWTGIGHLNLNSAYYFSASQRIFFIFSWGKLIMKFFFIWRKIFLFKNWSWDNKNEFLFMVSLELS